MRVHTLSPAEHFKGLVESALVNQHVQAGEPTAWYLVSLLCGFVDPRRGGQDSTDDHAPLALRLAAALEAGGVKRRWALRRVGDNSLFIAGCFADSLQRQLVDIDYYAAIGSYAYGSLSRHDGPGPRSTFTELADRFAAFADVLCEVSEASRLSTNQGILRLYEKWLRGSERSGRQLAARGIAPNESIKQRFVQ